MIKTFSKNKNGKDYIIGDIHGCFDDVQSILKQLNFDKSKDRLFSVGDLIDRGNNSEACLELTLEPWFHSVLGNHEQMLIDYHKGFASQLNYWYNGGYWAISMLKEERQYYVDLAESLPLLIELETRCGIIGIVHSEFPYIISDWNELKSNIANFKDDCLWGRTQLKRKVSRVIDNIDHIVSGHTIIDHVTTWGNQTWIDCGGLSEGRFCVIDCDTMESQIFKFDRA